MNSCFATFAFLVWEYWLGKTKKLVANSTMELAVWFTLWLGKQLLTKGKLLWIKMSNWVK